MKIDLESSPKGPAIIAELTIFYPAQIFTLERDLRPTSRMLLEKTVVMKLGSSMVRERLGESFRLVLVMLGAEIGWVWASNIVEVEE